MTIGRISTSTIFVFLILGALYGCSGDKQSSAQDQSQPTLPRKADRIAPAQAADHPQAARTDLDKFNFKQVDYMLTDTSGANWEIQWNLAVDNLTAVPIELKARLRLVDANRQIIFEKIVRQLTLEGNEDGNLHGILEVPADIARRTQGITADVAPAIENRRKALPANR